MKSQLLRLGLLLGICTAAIAAASCSSGSGDSAGDAALDSPNDGSDIAFLAKLREHRKTGSSVSMQELDFTAPDSADFQMRVHHVGAGELDPSGWTRATSTEGGFSVLMPNLYNDFTLHAKAPDGVTATNCQLATLDERHVKFAAMRIQRADGSILGDPLHDFQDLFAPDIVRKQRALRFDNMDGAEARVATDLTISVYRTLRSGNTVYRINVQAPSSLHFRDIESDVNRFMDSLTITPAAN